MTIGGAMKINYQRLMEKEIAELEGKKPKLLLHSCCGPCSTAVIARLKPYFQLTVFFYNPNIFPQKEYLRRKEEQVGYLNNLYMPYLIGDYEPDSFYRQIKGLENQPEGGSRCQECFKMRLYKTALVALAEGFEYFTTTLSVSPHKDSQVINLIGKEIENKYLGKIKYLPSDFKKAGGYQESVIISREVGMYRQDYCGCSFSIEGRVNNVKNQL